MIAVAFFSCEADKDGKSAGWELSCRISGLAEILRRHPDWHVFFAKSAPGFIPPTQYGELVKSRLDFIDDDKIHICGDLASTASEIDTIETELKKYPEFESVLAASSDYHVQRVVRLWKIRHGRQVISTPLRMQRTLYIRKRAALCSSANARRSFSSNAENRPHLAQINTASY